ncbi:MAG: FAM221A/B family protein [archaeon]|nr:FAM221A/B family protein [archaeon]
MDRINMNVFRQMRNEKRGLPSNKKEIFAKPKPKDPNKKFTRPTGQYTLGMGENPKEDPYAFEALPAAGGNEQQMDLYYANPNNYQMDNATMSLQTKTSVNKHGVVTRTNGSGITTLQAVVKGNKGQPEAYQYKVRTKKCEDPDLDYDPRNNQLSAQEKKVAKMQARVLVNTVKNNRLTFGTQQMMDNERLHAQEAIESGIYVTWSTTSPGGKTIDCFRVGSNSMCICGHGFPNHECILTKRFSTKCKSCKCKGFQYIPLYPEEVGNYWQPYQKHFSYDTWKAKCKCKHGWNEHRADGYYSCKTCGCSGFNSDFCCAVCNKFWQDHEMIYELENERIANGKPVREDYIPFNEMPEMYDALYK